MHPLKVAYLIGFTLSVLTLLPVVYGVYVNGLTTRIKKAFFGMVIINTGWTVTQIIQVYLSDITVLLGAELFTTIFLCLSTYSMYIFTIVYTESNWLLKDKWIIGSTIPFLIFGLNLIHKRLVYVPTLYETPFSHIVYPLTTVDLGFILFVFLLYVLMYALLIHTYWNKRFKYNSVPVFAFGVAVPVIFGFASYIPGLPLPQINHAPLGFPVLAISFAIAVFGFDMLDIKPMALEQFAEELPDPVFILDSDKRIIETNQTAELLFGKETDLLNKNISFLPFDSEKITDIFKDETSRHIFEASLEKGKPSQLFTLTTAPVCKEGNLIGWVVHMKDVTEVEKTKTRTRTTEYTTSTIF